MGKNWREYIDFSWDSAHLYEGEMIIFKKELKVWTIKEFQCLC